MALKSAEVDENGVVKLECSQQALMISQLPQLNTGPCSNLMLLRETYKEIHGKIFDNFKRGGSLSRQVCVLGTAGIGKSSFRYFILRQWLRGEIEIQFNSVLVNVSVLIKSQRE
jgi:ABC-type transport system involved in cytochrome bd biosynthesis fused ATPase/permease subunit